MNKNKIANIIYIYLILQPILDLFTSLMTRFIDIPFTIGMIVRGLFLMWIVVYTIFISKSTYKNKSIIYLSILFCFVIFYFITKGDIFDINFLITEVTYLFKYMYFPIIAVCLMGIYDELNIEKEKIFKISIINIIIYSLLVLIPEISGSSFSSYLDDNKGTVGWFYAANEIGAIAVSLFPYMYYLLFERNSIVKDVLLFTIVILAMTLLGTKTSFLGMLITEIVYFLYFLFNSKKNRGLGLKISIVIIILSFVLIPNIPAVKNLQNAISQSNELQEETNIDDEYTFGDENIQRIVKIALSGRDKFFFRTVNIYNNAKCDDQLFGIGFVNRKEINNDKIEKLIEIDVLDVFFHYGLIGFIIYFWPLFNSLFKVIKQIFQKRFEFSFFKVTNIYIIGIVTLISMLAGHVYGAPSVSINIAISIAMLNSAIVKVENKNNEVKDKKKITILALHLNYGGVEQYISSLCKMIEDSYEIEIISTYKMSDKPAFDFSDNIKISYLIEDKPNKEQFKLAVKNKDIIQIVKEGFKAIKILFLKRHLNIKAIRNIHSDYIITTRSFHNRLVGYYAYDNIKKIATEHNYHNNDRKYITNVINSIRGFDYFVVVSKELQEFYNNKIGSVKCVYIPNVIDNMPKSETKLKDNNIINIGRLEEEKAQSELIDIVKDVSKEVDDIKLYLIGDGSLRSELEKKVKNNNLENNVIFTGFISKNDMEKYLINSKLFVMTSYTESFGLVLIEAMSYKVPCIAYDSASGAKQLLKDNNGILVKGRNKKKMTEEIIKLLKDDKTIKKYSERGYLISQNYLGSNVKKMWFKILK